MRIFVVGAGAVGSVLASMLTRGPGQHVVTCGDRDPARAKAFLAGVRGVGLVRVDASSDASVARAARGTDLVINAGLPDFNLAVMRAALRIGAHYQDMCSRLEDLRHAEQISLDGEFRRAGLVALVNTGVAPGLTNLLAADLAAQFDRPRAVRVRLLEDQDADEPVMSWSPRVIIDELASPPLTFRRGRFGLTTAFADAETFAFPAPFGKRRVVSVYGDEIATLPLYLKGIRDADMKSGGTDIEFGAAISAAGMLSATPVRVGGATVRPRDVFEAVAPKVPSPAELRALVKKGSVRNAWLVASVEVDGAVRGRTVTRVAHAAFPDLRAVMRRHPGATYVAHPTAACAAAFSRIIPTLQRRGAFPPEALDVAARRAVLADVARAGITIRRAAR